MLFTFKRLDPKSVEIWLVSNVFHVKRCIIVFMQCVKYLHNNICVNIRIFRLRYHFSRYHGNISAALVLGGVDL